MGRLELTGQSGKAQIEQSKITAPCYIKVAPPPPDEEDESAQAPSLSGPAGLVTYKIQN